MKRCRLRKEKNMTQQELANKLNIQGFEIKQLEKVNHEEEIVYTVGNGSVIGAGSVVTRDIPEGVLAAGNPCRVIREITDEDSIYLKAKRD